MRVKLQKVDLELFFDRLVKGGSWKSVAAALGVTSRTLYDWRSGKISLPGEVFRRLEKDRIRDLNPTYLPNFWNAGNSGKRGGFARNKLHGNAGTPEGRRRGGYASLTTHNRSRTGFVTLKKVSTPPPSLELAELLGILIGDGHLSQYCVEVTTNSQTDFEHARFVKDLLENLFKAEVRLKLLTTENTAKIFLSSRSAVLFLNNLGMPIGNKIKNGTLVPRWILSNSAYQKSFLRGLFDTDGCIYLDIHTIRGRKYFNPCWTITSYSPEFLKEIVRILIQFGYSPTNRASQKSVYLRRKADIERYFKEIGSHNPKHLKRYQTYIQKMA